MDRWHTYYAGTGAVCTSTCSRISGTVINKVLSRESVNKDMLKIEHPSGVMPVFVQIDKEKTEKKPYPIFKVLPFVSTPEALCMVMWIFLKRSEITW